MLKKQFSLVISDTPVVSCACAHAKLTPSTHAYVNKEDINLWLIIAVRHILSSCEIKA